MLSTAGWPTKGSDPLATCNAPLLPALAGEAAPAQTKRGNIRCGENRGRRARGGHARAGVPAGRPGAKPRRWILPITAFRETPISAAIWLQLKPVTTNIRSCSTRSGVQVAIVIGRPPEVRGLCWAANRAMAARNGRSRGLQSRQGANSVHSGAHDAALTEPHPRRERLRARRLSEHDAEKLAPDCIRIERDFPQKSRANKVLNARTPCRGRFKFVERKPSPRLKLT